MGVENAWTPEGEAMLARLYRAGTRYAEIAARLTDAGHGFRTKNSICGKIDRMIAAGQLARSGDVGSAYADFLAGKKISDPATGLDGAFDLPEAMFDFQRDITRWALRRGRAALFAGTGLGKTLMELAWGSTIAREAGGMVLLFAPLAVSQQIIREATKFAIEARLVSSQEDCGPGINVTNYQKIDRFKLDRFAAIILDESSILKSTDGHYRTRLIKESTSVPYRLAATATPAPNDFMELGNHAEFLGAMSYTDMLSTFFTHDGGETQKWRLKGHAESDFWKWLASIAVMIRQPSDLGYEDGSYKLPPIHRHQHTVHADFAPSIETGTLFPMEARTMQERLSARRDTVGERVAAAFSIVIGSYCDKLAAWSGNPNTPNVDAPNTKLTPQNASDGKSKVEIQKKTPNTCGIITKETAKNSGEHQSNRPKSIGAGESGTLPTLNSESKQKHPLGTELPNNEESSFFEGNTGSSQHNTTPCLPVKTASAPSVEQSLQSFSTLITAMRVAKSEGYFAAHATPDSVISKMTRNGSIEPWCIWCNLNSEQDALAKAFGPLAYSVSGSMPDAQKESAILDWIDGKRPVMISKPSIMGFGMNFQHCRNTIFVGLSDSFEQVYQAERRFWRFGQTQPVNVHFIAAETEGAVVANLRRKEADAERMASAMVHHMADLSSAAVRGAARETPDYNPTQPIELPSWLGEAA